MKKSELIEILEKIDGDPVVGILLDAIYYTDITKVFCDEKAIQYQSPYEHTVVMIDWK